MISTHATEAAMVRTEVPGPNSAAHWVKEQRMLGPGLQAAVQWAQLCLKGGEGPFVIDIDDNVYVDLMGASGVNSIGHSHPKLIKALGEQLSSLMIGGFASQARLAMLETLAQCLPAGLDKIQLYSGGTEAVEAGLRLAKSYTKKFEFMSFWQGYHGKTAGSLALTDGSRQGMGPIGSGFYNTPYANCYRCRFKLQHPACGFACVEFARDTIRHNTTGALAGIVVEPVQGKAGNVTPPTGYLKELQQLAREFDALLIVDETITGFGRTGKMFASEYDEVVPDIMIVGKGMGGGFPVTGVVSSSKIMASAPFSEPSASSSSFGAFPVACQAVNATVRIILEENLVEAAANLGAELLDHLRTTAADIPLIGRVHGKGLMLGIELVYNCETKTPISKQALQQIYRALLQKGVLVMTGGNCLRFYPPLSIEPQVAKRTMNTVLAVLDEQSQLLDLEKQSGVC